MPEANVPLLTSAKGKGLRWNNYLARRLRPRSARQLVRWVVEQLERIDHLDPAADHQILGLGERRSAFQPGA